MNSLIYTRPSHRENALRLQRRIDAIHCWNTPCLYLFVYTIHVYMWNIFIFPTSVKYCTKYFEWSKPTLEVPKLRSSKVEVFHIWTWMVHKRVRAQSVSTVNSIHLMPQSWSVFLWSLAYYVLYVPSFRWLLLSYWRYLCLLQFRALKAVQYDIIHCRDSLSHSAM